MTLSQYDVYTLWYMLIGVLLTFAIRVHAKRPLSFLGMVVSTAIWPIFWGIATIMALRDVWGKRDGQRSGRDN